MDIIALTTLLIKLDNGEEKIVYFDSYAGKIYPSGVIDPEDELKIVEAIRSEAEPEVDIPEPVIVEDNDLDSMMTDIDDLVTKQEIGDDNDSREV